MTTRIHTLKLHIKEAVIKAIDDGEDSTNPVTISLTDLASADTSKKVGLGMPVSKETQTANKEVYLLQIDFSTPAGSTIDILRKGANGNEDVLIYTIPAGFHDVMKFDYAPEDEFSNKDIIIKMTGKAVCILTLRKSQGYKQAERLAEFGRMGELNAGA